MPKGKIRQNQQQGYYFIIYYNQQNQRTDFRVLNNNIGNFSVDDKVSFTLTPQNQATNLAAVQRRYLIPGMQGNALDVILLGVKRPTYAGTQTALFAGGMPTVFGGDMNDGETNQQTVERELNEEIGYNVGLNHPVLQQIHQQNTRTNQSGTVTETCIFYTSPNVIPNNFVPVVPSTEVAGTFFLHLDAITVALNAPGAVLQQMCGIAGIVIADMNNLTQQQGEFLTSATLSALIVLLQQHRTARYNLGLQHIQTATAAANANVVYMAARNEYMQGLQRAQTGQLAANNAPAAYMAGYNEYTQGLQRAQANPGAASPNTAYMTGYNEYTQGLQRAQGGQGAASPNAAYMAGYNEYTQGLQRAQANPGAASPNIAYMAGYNEYTQGLQRAQANPGAASPNAAYMAGYNEYTQAWQQIQQTTLTASHNGALAVQGAQAITNPPTNHPASVAGHNEYIAGWQRAHNNLAPAANTRAYMEGYQNYI